MNVLKRFGDIYTFPTEQISYNDNFRELVLPNQRLPGAHGGFSQLGKGRGLQEVGMVQTTFWLHFDSQAEGQAQLDAIGAMNDAGEQPLIMQPMAGVERWCWAHVNNQQKPQSVLNLAHKRQRVQLSFRVHDPFWYAPGTETIWGLFDWNDGSLWSGAAGTVVTGSADLTLTNNGNAYTLARIIIKNTSGAVASNFRFRRLVNGAAADDLLLISAIASGAHVQIDPRRHRVYLNYLAYSAQTQGQHLSATHPDWLRLMPGENTVRVTLEGQATIGVRYMERYV